MLINHESSDDVVGSESGKREGKERQGNGDFPDFPQTSDIWRIGKCRRHSPVLDITCIACITHNNWESAGSPPEGIPQALVTDNTIRHHFPRRNMRVSVG
jgi:hypothetical protein